MTRNSCLSAAAVTLLACSVFAGGLSGPPEDVVVHEWGTFTSIAGPDGNALDWQPLSGNPDLPPFVCRFGEKTLLRATVRMETPVLYFYSSKETDVSVKVSFPSGTITEWYPATRKTNLHRNIRFLGAIKVEHRRFHPDSCPQKGFLSEAANERRQIRVSTQRLPIEGVAIRAGNRSEGTPLMNNHIFRRPTESSGETRTSQQRYGGCGNTGIAGHENLLHHSLIRVAMG